MSENKENTLSEYDNLMLHYQEEVLVAINKNLFMLGVEIALLKYFNKNLVNGLVEMSM